jgi:hypothetical protein
MSILINSSYNPARGGHAPGDLRTAFEEALKPSAIGTRTTRSRPSR